MDERVIIFKNEQGQVTICYPSNGTPVERVKVKDTPPDSIIVKKSRLPFEDYDFFDCWELRDGVNVTVSLEKAKEVTKQRLRQERKTLLAEQDIAFQRALETGANTEAIVKEKNRLRDLTKLVDQCTTLDELRKIKVRI